MPGLPLSSHKLSLFEDLLKVLVIRGCVWFAYSGCIVFVRDFSTYASTCMYNWCTVKAISHEPLTQYVWTFTESLNVNRYVRIANVLVWLFLLKLSARLFCHVMYYCTFRTRAVSQESVYVCWICKKLYEQLKSKLKMSISLACI